ncbi:Disease resistance protein (CC-NBS-LRR class) family [Rhynchospora pubera]|uniref:Disease resistance protein (CC-NBS-LRR class) family n=1 Tax=Rhynchospora pubera TaxID=906938 RepID=A0AAV8FBR7_9POAL|nr:Disease resistance protein (CC-NBS-LRR class) family [Rhynchospora pubera]
MDAAVMQFVVGKLGNMISNEAQLLGGVKDQVEWVQTKLMEIRCYLRDADSNRNTSALAENWLNQLRDMSYRMEDAVDTFHLELEDECKKDPGLLDKIKSLFPNPTSVPGLHKLGKELKNIKLDFEEILKSKSDYGIDPLQDQDRGSGVVDLIKRREVYEDIVDETEVVGLNAARDKILNMLLIHGETSTLHQKRKRDQEISKRIVITIVGPGGLGKTTLAHMVYRSAKAYFAIHMMLSVSQQFSQIDLLRKMLSELDNSRLERCKDVTDLIKNLKELLRRKRYLIILDDVWDTIVWEQLKNALPDAENGSRVLMTSRDEKVAKSTDYPKIYKPEFLDENKSLELLLKKAWQYQKPCEGCSDDIRKIAIELSKKCKGLPLALIVLGGILSLEKQTHSAWERVQRTMNWPEEGIDCMNVLNMSYDYMPYDVKQCFLYLASFPEDHKIRANCLIKMWIAEGFIPQKDNKTMEEEAEDYLELLFQRCMVQEAVRSPNGLIKYFKVHDLIRELAIKLSREKNFHTVFPKAKGVNLSDSAYRRVLLESCGTEFMKYVGKMNQKTRSLIWFGQRENNLPKFAEFRLLTVLEIVNVKMSGNTELKGLDGLIHLKYLGFKDCENIVIEWRCFSGRMKNLETLDLTTIWLRNWAAPTDIWTIDTLRHVHVHDFCAILTLSTKGDLSNLQTLKWLSTTACCSSQFPNLNNLLKLGLTTQGHSHKWDGVPHLLKNLSSLVSLHIRVSMLTRNNQFIPENIVYPRELPNYSNLKTLKLDGIWSEGVTLKERFLPPHLVKLKLGGLFLREDPMPELGKLKSLNKLQLHGALYIGEQMNCPSGFPVLQTLVLIDVNLKVLTVGNGVMPKLKYLIKSGRLRLNMPPELRHFQG